MDNTKIVNEITIHENRVKGYYGDIQKLKVELKEQKAMLKDALENDAEYANITAEIKKLQKERKGIKDKLEQDPSLALTKAKVEDINDELKDSQMAMFAHLDSYVAHTKATTIELDGDIKKIVTNYKLQSSE